MEGLHKQKTPTTLIELACNACRCRTALIRLHLRVTAARMSIYVVVYALVAALAALRRFCFDVTTIFFTFGWIDFWILSAFFLSGTTSV
mgnify:CR=1 FL=1